MTKPRSYDTFELAAKATCPRNVGSGVADAVLPRHGIILGASKTDHGAPSRRHRGLFSRADGRLLNMAAFISAVTALLVFTCKALPSKRSLAPQVSNGPKGTTFLNHEDPLSSFYGQTFLKDNIPYIDIPDSLIEDVYYYRWTSLQRNIRYVVAGTGYMCTEFVHPVGYAEAFGTIDAAAGHQIDESRWLRNTVYADDYIQLYTRGPADSLQYTQWILDAASRRAMVTGDSQFLANQLSDMVRTWHLWDPYFDSTAGLYYYEPVWDAQELSLPGFIVDPNGTDWNLRLNGPDTFRPSHNAYMVANARAIANAADLAHDQSTQSQFLDIANKLETAIYKRLWAPEQEFFMDVIRPGNPNLTRLAGREEVGLYPYRFGIGLNETYAQPAVDSMFDPMGFSAPYGPTTLEIRNHWFASTKPDPSYCCWWNGMSWPFSTSHSLKSLAAIYRSGTTNVTAEQYHEYLQMYARTQQKNGQPYVAESHYPFENAWSADTTNHSEHYDHSTNNDDVITGLLGIIPQPDNTLQISPIVPSNWTYFALENLPYHGHLVTVLYDEDGSRYGVGPGLSVFVDGANAHRGSHPSAVVSIPPPVLPGESPVNIAANPAGLGHYPTANATFTYVADWSYKAIDGVVYYDQVPDDRWTNYLSPNDNDTLTVSFARPHNVSSVTLALYSDIARGGSVDLPAKIEVYGSSGLIKSVGRTTNLLANDYNEITFDAVETTFIAVNMYRKSSKTWVGVCELEVWTPPPTGPVYYAVDAYLTGASTKVIFDPKSKAASNGAVVAAVGSDSNVAFSGIQSDGKPKRLTLSYANLGKSSVNVSVDVNQVNQVVLALPPSKGKYVTITTHVTPAVGKNYITVRGGSDGVDVRLETLTIS
ncbi:Six-hairpin glycosidase [Xylaria intraflava]|nr:Six-hairpin glycosidase [Xylaria intraflava]